MKVVLYLTLMVLFCSMHVHAQKRYRFGFNYTLPVQSLNLSKINDQFKDIRLGHSSGIYFYKKVNDHFNWGYSTLVASYKDHGTEVLLQTAGVFLSAQAKSKFFPFASLILGGMLAHADKKISPINSSSSTAVHYRGKGFMMTPGIGVGYDGESFHTRLSVKQTYFLGKSKVSALNQTYAGVEYGFNI